MLPINCIITSTNSQCLKFFKWTNFGYAIILYHLKKIWCRKFSNLRYILCSSHQRVALDVLSNVGQSDGGTGHDLQRGVVETVRQELYGTGGRRSRCITVRLVYMYTGVQCSCTCIKYMHCKYMYMFITWIPQVYIFVNNCESLRDEINFVTSLHVVNHSANTIKLN